MAVFGGIALEVLVESPGGNVDVGMGIYHALRARKGDTVSIVPAFAASAATLPVMAAKTRLIGRQGILMIHDITGYASGDPEALRAAAAWIELLRKAVVQVYAEASGQSAEQALAAMCAETWMGSRSAISLGYCTALAEDDLPREDAFMLASRAEVARAARMGGGKLMEQARRLRKKDDERERLRICSKAQAELSARRAQKNNARLNKEEKQDA